MSNLGSGVIERLVDLVNVPAGTLYFPTEPNNLGWDLREPTELVLTMINAGGESITVEHTGVRLTNLQVPTAAEWFDVTADGVPLVGAPQAAYLNASTTVRWLLPKGRARVRRINAGAANTLRMFAQLRDMGEAVSSGSALLNLIAGTTSGTNVHSTALEISHVISPSPCHLRSCKTLNNSGANLWMHLYDAVALPANGTIPDRCPIPVVTGSVNGDSWPGSTRFAVGCVAVLSSTLATLTAIVANDAWFDAELVP